MKPAKHNKKRNAGLLYEFLARHAARGFVEKDDVRVKRSIKLMKKFFKEGTELHREFRLFRALFNTTVNDRSTAQRIIESARAASRQHDFKQLDHEKSLLIRSINHTLGDESFFDQRVDEYRRFATIQLLLNEWRAQEVSDVVRVAILEEELVEQLLLQKQNNVLEETRDDVDDLIVKLMMKNVSSRYEGVLNKEQTAIMDAYVCSMSDDDDGQLLAMLESLRNDVLTMVDSYALKHVNEQPVLEKLMSIKELLAESVVSVDDAIIARYLRIARLKQEMDV